MNTKLIAATCIALALSRWSATHAYAEVTFPLQGQWCLSSSFEKARPVSRSPTPSACRSLLRSSRTIARKIPSSD